MDNSAAKVEDADSFLSLVHFLKGILNNPTTHALL